MQKIKKGDQIIVVTGKDKGKRGTVERVMPEAGRVVVEGVNIAKRHTRGNPGRNVNPAIVEKAMPLHISNVAIYNSGTGKGDRVGFRFLEDGRKVRYFKSSQEIIDT
ncbi:50S ribosomal subunit protein L24 [Gammaproteobacteria bacterium]